MRLKLTVERNALPSVDLVWNIPVDTAHPPQTVANLLEQVNDAIPLEAEQWGLEDYLVEVDGFECLHYSSVHHVLREDDRVRIRPLQTTEIRARRVSGRDQISNAGLHLLDGMPFGKSSTRRPTRPEISIPPRKRARLLPPENEEKEPEPEPVNDVLSAMRNVYEKGQELGRAKIEAERIMNQAEASGTNQPLLEGAPVPKSNKRPIENSEDASPRKRTRPPPPADTGNDPDIDRTKLDPFMAAILDLYERAGEDEDEEEGNEAPTANSHKDTGVPSTNNQDQPKHKPVDPLIPALLALFGHNDSLSQENDGIEGENNTDVPLKRAQPKPNTKQITQTAQNRSRQGEKKVRFDAGALENIENALPSDDEESDEDFVDDMSSSDDDSDEDSVGDNPVINDHGGNTSSLPNDGLAKSDKRGEDKILLDDDSDGTSDTSSDSNSESDSDSEVEEAPVQIGTGQGSHKRKDKKVLEGSSSSTSDSDTSDSNSNSSDGEPEIKPISKKAIDPQPGIPREGKRVTKSRNIRRHKSKVLQKLKSVGALPKNATLAQLDKYFEDSEGKANTRLAQKRPESTNSTEIDSTAGLSTEERKQRDALLQGLESGGIDVTSFNGNTKKAHESGRGHSDSPLSISVEVDSTHEDVTMNSHGSENPKKRSRLDVSGTRRVLFNSLGLRVPKSQADVEALKGKLLSRGKRKPIKKLGKDEPSLEEMDLDTEENDDIDAWKSKIVLNAVECCEDGIVLSTPPFPFVQRWDPQQQYTRPIHGHNGDSSRKKKRRQRNRTDYYEDYAGYEEEAGEVFDLNYDEEEPSIDIPKVDSAVDVNDLPPLPSDVMTLRSLSQDGLGVGCIVVFKQLDCSPETNWQPLVSEWRTGTIESIDDKGHIELTLAQRDRSHREIERDENGKRIYGKFEMQNDDDAEDEVDDGYRSVSFSELMELRLLQDAPEDMELATEEPVKEDSTTLLEKIQASVASPSAGTDVVELAVAFEGDNIAISVGAS